MPFQERKSHLNLRINVKMKYLEIFAVIQKLSDRF